MKRPTIRDVAGQCGYSITTVSMVLNNRTDVSIPQATRERVFAAAKALGYRPNHLAVGLRSKQSMVLGLIIPDSSNMYFASLSKAIEKTARANGYNVLYGNTDSDPQQDLEYIEMFIDRQIDGVIYARSPATGSTKTEDNILRVMRSASIPFVIIDRPFHGAMYPTVLLNHFQGGYLATRYLMDCNHRRIGCFTGPDSLFSSKERVEGYRLALQEGHIPFEEDLLFEGNYRMENEEEALAHFLSHGVTAIYCCNDLMALGLYRAARRRGISIPQDLSIIGFDNISLGELVDPPLTTIHQPVEEIGQCATRILVELLAGKRESDIQINPVFEPQLIIRDSVRRLEYS